MAEVTVNDIIGVGFKYEQSAQEIPTPAPTGTRIAVLGKAHWGPVNTPFLITQGQSEFRSKFGDLSPLSDDGHASADYAFGVTQVGYYTRISDGTDVKSYRVAKLNDSPAAGLSTAAIAPSVPVLVPGVSDTLTINFQDTSLAAPWAAGKNINVVFTGAALATRGEASIENTGTAGAFVGTTVPAIPTDNYALDVTIDGGSLQQLVIAVNVADDWSDIVAAIDAALAAGSQALIAGGEIVIRSDAYGTTSTVLIAAGTGAASGGDLLAAIDAVTGYDPVLTTPVAGVNSLASEIVTQINAAVVADADFIADYPTFLAPASIVGSGVNLNKLQVVTPFSGATVDIAFSGTADAVLGMNDATGTTGKNIGTFLARETGRDGNRIRYTYQEDSPTENILRLFFRGNLIGTLVNVSFDSNAVNFIENLINDDEVLNQVVEYLHGKDQNGVALVPPVTSADHLQDGDDQYLANGLSGEGAIDPVTDLIPEISKYSNVRLYKLDLIAAPGYPEQAVQTALDDTCKKRQDCAGLIETPLLGSRAAIEQWYNGQGSGRTEKLDTYYLWLYGPYLKVRKRTFGTTDQETTTSLGDYSPLTRVIGAVCRSDALSNTKLRPPAGAVRSTITDVEGLQLDLTAEDEERLQGEEYDGIFNPVIFTVDDGFYINGNRSALRKNSNGKLTSLAYIESVRVGFAVKRQAEERSKFYFFEPNDPRLRESFEADLRGILKTLEEQRAIKAGWVVDTSSAVNTTAIERQGGLVAVLEFTTTRAVRKIKIYATLTEPGNVSISAA